MPGICPAYKVKEYKGKSIKPQFHFCDPNKSINKLDNDDDVELKLTVYLNNKSKNYKEMLKHVKSSTTRISVKCTGVLWKTDNGCGIKMYAHSIEK